MSHEFPEENQNAKPVLLGPLGVTGAGAIWGPCCDPLPLLMWHKNVDKKSWSFMQAQLQCFLQRSRCKFFLNYSMIWTLMTLIWELIVLRFDHLCAGFCIVSVQLFNQWCIDYSYLEVSMNQIIRNHLDPSKLSGNKTLKINVAFINWSYF